MSEFILPDPNVIVDPISDSECSNLGNNTGLDLDDLETTCEALENRLLPLISQIVGDISNGTKTIYANDDSKCTEGDKSPTLASMFSRIYRVSQAFACILCQYDPNLSNMLMNGIYPQILMGKPEDGSYPMWVNPDSLPTENSNRPVTSDGVYKAIQNAIMSVWHMWDRGNDGNFYDFANNVADLVNGTSTSQYAIVYNTSSHNNVIYKWGGSAWVENETVTNIEDFAVIHVEKGKYADKGLYWFNDGWNVLDADLSDIEDRLNVVENKVANAVGQLDTSTKYEIGIVDSYSEAIGVPSTTGKTKIIFIRGTS